MDNALNNEIGIPQKLYISQLILDMHRRDVWRLLGDTYALHRRLSIAFPEAVEGGSGRVLFRVDSGKGEARIIVQSHREPDWSQLADLFAESPRGPKEWPLWKDEATPIFAAGQRLRYRLRANPTFRCNESRGGLTKGKRYAHLTRKSQAEWLVHKGQDHGFELPPLPEGQDWLDAFYDEPEQKEKETPFDIRITPLEWLQGNKPTVSGELKHYGVDFEGTLTVTAPAAFAAAVAGGIGPAKGFGFGLLSLARV